MALAGSHPDIEVIAKPEDKSDLPVALFLGDKEHRGREGLCHWIGLKPFMGGRRIAIIDDADFFNDAGANCLLKTLEEPPPRSVLILISTSPARQLPTIRSRCQLVRFRPLDEPTVARLLVAKNLVNDPKEAARLARYSEGSIRQAVELSDAELWNFRRELLGYLSAESLDSVGLAPKIAAFVDAAGKEAPARRARFRQVVGFAADFYRRMVFAQRSAAEQFRRRSGRRRLARAVGDGGRALSRRRDGRRRVPPGCLDASSSRSTATPTSQR